MTDTVDTGTLPGAVLEETFWPDQIVCIPNDDGSVHMLMYVGESGVDGGFFSLKHAIISPEHAAGLFRPVEQPEDGSRGPERARGDQAVASPRAPLHAPASPTGGDSAGSAA
jgi:hypothetical protein